MAFHIQNLFNGNLCVLHENDFDADPFGVPHHPWVPPKTQRKSLSYKLNNAGHIMRSVLLHRTTKVPFGSAREGILAFLKDEAPDAILAEFGTAALRIAPVIAETGLPFFTYFRGADASSHLRQPLRVAGYKRMMPHLDGVFSVAQFLFDELASFGVIHPNSHVIPSGVNTDRFTPVQKRPNSFLAVGRLIEKKRPDITIRSFCEAAGSHADATLEVVGDGALLDPCQAIASDYGMSDRVIFHGAQPHGFVAEKLATSQVLLQHSVRAKDGNTEGLPMTIQEAMASGMVVISTRHAGIPEAVREGQNGFLVDEGDEAGFAAAITQVLETPDALGEMGHRNRVLAVADYDNRVLIKRVEAEIVRVIAARG
ncbi:MAG: glycosyltransferase [Pseudomonadota bacterium]